MQPIEQPLDGATTLVRQRRQPQHLTLTAAANGGSTPPVYTTAYDFDSFGRLHRLTNPDGELIVNRYDTGGNLQSVHGRLNGAAYEYLKSLTYDRFESRVRLELANGMVTRYSYDPKTRRLDKLQAGKGGTGAGNDLQDLAYGYDSVGNILSLVDSAPIPKSNEYGGQSGQNFYYDDLYRLVKADGTYTTAREVQTYALGMAFDEIHNITHKSQTHTVAKNGGTPRIERATSYDWAYAYGQRQHKQPHAPTQIGNRTFEFDANGNQSGWQNLDNGTRRTIVWDEDNRIREVQDPKHGAAFSYDDQGERKLKKSQYGETAYITQFFTVRNGAIASTHVYAGTTRIATKVGAGTPVGKVKNGNTPQGTGNIDPATASLTEYVAPDGSTSTTATPTTLAPLGRGQGEGQARRAATTSDKGQSANQATFPGQGLEHRSERANEVARNTEKNKHLNGGDPGGIQGAANSNAGGHESNAGGNGNNGNAWGRTGERGNSGHLNNGQGGQGQGNAGGQGSANGNGGGNAGGGQGGGTGGTGDGREFVYFYHPDHLGSSAYVTDEKANRYEHLAYFPFGETWVQESTATWRVPYQYTAKEMDSETGLYYFGARYYDPRTSVWVSADPIDRFTPESPPLGLNLYQYGLWNPIRYVDPTGLNEAEAGSVRQFASELNVGGFVKQLGRKLLDDFVQNNQADSPKSNALYRWAAEKLKDSYEKPDSTSANGVAATVAVAAAGIISPNKAGTANAVKGVATQEALAAKVLTEAGELRLSASVADKYAATRPYVTPLTVQETIAGGVRVPDPQGVAGRFMYTVDSIYNKSVGKFEVLVNELTNTVEHALFKSGK